MLHRAASVTFTRDNDVLDVFAGVVGDADVHFDGLTVVVNLETVRQARTLEWSCRRRLWR